MKYILIYFNKCINISIHSPGFIYISTKMDDCCWKWCGTTCPKNLNRNICIFTLLFGLLLLIILLPLSVKNVNEQEVGIPYNKITRSVGSVRTTGRYYETPSTDMFSFQSSFITYNREQSCYSNDQVEMVLDVSVRYKLDTERVRDALFAVGKMDAIVGLTEDRIYTSILGACSYFSSNEFYGRRTDVEQAVVSNVSSILNSPHTFVRAGFVELKNIRLPGPLMDAIARTEEVRENIQRSENSRLQRLTIADTRVIEATSEASIVVIEALARAESIVIEAENVVEQRRDIWNTRLERIVNIVNTLGFDSEETVAYLQSILKASVQTPRQRLCIDQCKTGTCWWCYVGAENVAPVVN